MPYIAIKAYPKDDDTKRKVIEAVNNIFAENWGCAPDAISISLEEVAPEEWDEKVRKTQIEPNKDKMYILDGKKQYQ